MSDMIINDKYRVIDTIYSDIYQSIFICCNNSAESDTKYILYEFTDKEIIDVVKYSFPCNGDVMSKSLMDSFQIDDKYYALLNLTLGIPLEEYLSKHNITLADRMLLTEQLLKRFIEIEKCPTVFQYILCDLSNLSVTNQRYLCFNNLFCFDKNNLNIDFSMVSKRIGQIICCIFANTPKGDIIKDKDAMPPAILPIASTALEGSYNSAAKIYEDFKETLLYTTFIDSSSLDDRIRNKMKKAQKRYVISWSRLITSIVVLAALLGCGYWKLKGFLPVTAPGTGVPNTIARNNTSPVAEFSISINKIYLGDNVTFIDKSSDSDPGDIIKSRLWAVKKNDTIVFNSDSESMNYVFDETGDYEISLVVQDSNGASSQPYTHQLKILEKPEIPSDTTAAADNSENNK